jgi:hypothetical protein
MSQSTPISCAISNLIFSFYSLSFLLDLSVVRRYIDGLFLVFDRHESTIKLFNGPILKYDFSLVIAALRPYELQTRRKSGGNQIGDQEENI